MIVLRDTNIRASDSKSVAKVFQDLLTVEDAIDQDKEHFYVMHLDARNKVKMVELVAIGTIDNAVTAPREVFRRAIVEGSSSIVIAHNHPSNEVEPSDADIAITRRLMDAGNVVGISLVDHIIFTKDTYFSMKENH